MPDSSRPLIDELTNYGGNADESSKSLYEIARYQRLICYCILARLLTMAATIVPAVLATQGGNAGPNAGLTGLLVIVGLFSLALSAVQIYGIYKLKRALGGSTVIAALMAIASLLGLLGLIIMVLLSTQATKRLQEAGLKVGLLGVSRQAIDKHFAATTTGNSFGGDDF